MGLGLCLLMALDLAIIETFLLCRFTLQKCEACHLTALIPLDPSSLGPAMAALPPGTAAFVHAKIHLGLTNTEAARLAGYSQRSPHSLEVTASQIAHPRVQAALLEEGQKLMRSEGPKSIRTLVEIRDDKSATTADRAKAATELLNRSGFHAATQHNISVEVSLTDAQKDERILLLAKELGLVEGEARKLLIAPDKVIDAEFTEVTPAPELSAEEQARRARQRSSPRPAQHDAGGNTGT